MTVVTEKQSRSVAGTVFADGRPRIVNIKGIRMDAEFGPSMLYITNLDKPGFIGRFSSTLGEAGINIATFHVGRDAPGGNAIALIEIDGEVPAEVLRQGAGAAAGAAGEAAAVLEPAPSRRNRHGRASAGLVGWVEPLRNPSPRGIAGAMMGFARAQPILRAAT